MRRAFTLVELLVVITIILVVSAIALPMIISGLSHRQVSEAARILQAALAGARDAAIRDNAPSGIRLLPDPTAPNACNRLIPLMQPPSYQEGLVSVFPSTAYPATVLLGTLALVLEEQVNDSLGLPNPPTSWFWNIRVGDKVQINSAGPWYTVCGPTITSNPEGFANVGQPGTASPLGHDYLLLTNGRDDPPLNGWIDEGWDGVDNDNDGLTDETTCKLFPVHGEWEQEIWLGSLSAGVKGVPYTIRRRPVPGTNARETPLPSNVVVDLSRSKIQMNPLTTSIDIIVYPDGTLSPSVLYSTPASVSLGASFFQFWLAERSDLGLKTPVGQWWLISANGKTGNVTAREQPDLVTGYTDAMQ